MKCALFAAGVAHLIAGAWMLIHSISDHGGFFCWVGWGCEDRTAMTIGPGIASVVTGILLLVGSHAPVRWWPLVAVGFLKVNLFIAAFAFLAFEVAHPGRLFVFLLADDLIWWLPLAATLWAAVRAHLGQPFHRDTPLTLEEAGERFHLSTGESLAEASRDRTLALVFLRHFGCTFTRKILRELEQLQERAEQEGAQLVLVHMLGEGDETRYVNPRRRVARISDPLCELYQAFGLHKGTFLELFGPRVLFAWLRLMIGGCGVGHVAGDGLQLPGAFLFRDGRILAAQRAHQQSELPDLPALFDRVPEITEAGRVPA